MHKWLMPLSHKNSFLFKPSSRDFTVEEIPLYPFSGDGEHLIIKVRKKDLSTWEMLDIISNSIGVRKREIGYAGLKDKYAMTIQYLSLPIQYEKSLSKIDDKRVKILEITRHRNKIRIGHLKGNRFFLRFKKVLGVQKEMIESVLRWIEQEGSPNYFGVQRFGNDGDNWIEGQELVHKSMRLRDKKMQEFLISAYQSKLFNDWLSKRIEISRLLQEFKSSEVERLQNLPKDSLKDTKSQKQFFKLLEGDILMHYPYGKIFYNEDSLKESDRFIQKDISITGALSGRKLKEAKGVSYLIEKAFLDPKIKATGTRRYAWIFPQDINGKYIPQEAHYELSFYLPKGSYATVVVDMLRGS